MVSARPCTVPTLLQNLRFEPRHETHPVGLVMKGRTLVVAVSGEVQVQAAPSIFFPG